MRVAFGTKCGNYRIENEDSVLINKNLYSNLDIINSYSVKSKYSQFIVADGLGGEAFGSNASSIALSCFNSRKSETKQKLLENLQRAKDKLDIFSLENRDVTVGTTIAGVIINEEKVTVFNMGDTRIYRIRENQIEQLSKDHTYFSELGTSTEEYLTLGRNYLTSALIGNISKPITTIHFDDFSYKENDIYIICSDGVWSEVNESLILNLVTKYKLKTAVRRILEKSSATSMDNMSIICIK